MQSTHRPTNPAPSIPLELEHLHRQGANIPHTNTPNLSPKIPWENVLVVGMMWHSPEGRWDQM